MAMRTRDAYYERIREDIDKQAAAAGEATGCETCRDARLVKVRGSEIGDEYGVIRLIRCPDCTHDETKDRLLHRARVLEKTFGEWRQTAETQAAYDACMELLAGARWCVFLLGPPGLGKTHLAIATALDWYDRELGKPLILNAGRLLDELRDTQAPEAPRRLTDVLEMYAAVSLLVIDDLGAERATEWGVEQVYKIIDRRYAQKKPLIVTSNEMKTIRERFGARTYDRLSPGLVAVTGQSRRREFD